MGREQPPREAADFRGLAGMARSAPGTRFPEFALPLGAGGEGGRAQAMELAAAEGVPLHGLCGADAALPVEREEMAHEVRGMAVDELALGALFFWGIGRAV